MYIYFLISVFINPFLFSRNICPITSRSADTIYIHGEIKTLLQGKNTIVTFLVNDYVLARQLNYYSNIDSSGKFDIKFPVRCTQNIFWKYNEDSIFNLIVSPNDSLAIILDKVGAHFLGSGAIVNENMNLMWPLYKRSFPSSEEEKAIAQFEPEDYLIFRKKQKNKQIKFLDYFCKGRSCSTPFRQWYLANCEVTYYNELLAYGWKSLKYGAGSQVHLTEGRRNKYLASFIKNWPENGQPTTHLSNRLKSEDKDLLDIINFDSKKYSLSSQYFSLIHNLSNQYIQRAILTDTYLTDKIGYLLEYKNELSQIEIDLLHDIAKSYKSERDIDSLTQNKYYAIADRYKDRIILKMQKRWIDWEVLETQKIENPNIRDLILCQNFCNYIVTSDDANYYYDLIASKIHNVYSLKAITIEYEESKRQVMETNRLLLNDFRNVELVKTSDEKSGDQLINTILLANKNKVILIDLWGTWCGPCRADFVKMTSIKTQPPFDSVSFVYLCCLSTETEWINAIKKYNLKGTHYLITPGQYKALEKRFKIKGFPTYLVIDKQRKLHRNIVLSDTNALINQIKNLVN